MVGEGKGATRQWAGAKKAGLRAVELAGLVEFVLLGMVGALLAMLAWVLMVPLESPGAGDGPVVLDAPVRAVLFAQFDPFARDAPGGVAPLSLTLLGTRSGPDGTGSAILVGPDGVQRVVQQGEEALPGLRLDRVGFASVLFSRAGGQVTLELAPSQDDDVPAQGANSAPALHFSFVGRDGGIQGLAAQGSARFLGLEPGDRIVALAGQPVRGPGDAQRLEATLRQGGTMAVTVRRSGRELPLSLGSQP